MIEANCAHNLANWDAKRCLGFELFVRRKNSMNSNEKKAKCNYWRRDFFVYHKLLNLLMKFSDSQWLGD